MCIRQHGAHALKLTERPPACALRRLPPQDCWVGKGGAYTGEVSAEMLHDMEVPWVILGHSGGCRAGAWALRCACCACWEGAAQLAGALGHPGPLGWVPAHCLLAYRRVLWGLCVLRRFWPPLLTSPHCWP